MDLLSTCNKDALNIIHRYIHRFYLTKVNDEYKSSIKFKGHCIFNLVYNQPLIGKYLTFNVRDLCSESMRYNICDAIWNLSGITPYYLPKNYQFSGISEYSIQEFIKNNGLVVNL